MNNNAMPPATNSINWTEVGIIVGIIGALLSVLAFIVSKIFNLGKISNRLQTVESDTKDIKKDIKELGRDLTKRMDEIMSLSARKGLAESQSPMQLSDKGKKVLKNSGIDTVVSDKFDSIVEQVKKLKPANSYQAEHAVLTVVSNLVNDPTLKDAIEEGAFNSGYAIGSVLFAGGLYIRDRVLEKLDFKIDEIDKHDPAKK